MPGETLVGFDSLATCYDDLWSTAPAGLYQRRAFWEAILPLFQPGQTILDVGCGTGVDAQFLMAGGIKAEGVDASQEMVRIARAKGINAAHLAVEQLSELTRTYDGAISNFGVLNCVDDLEQAGLSLARLIRPGGHLAVCTIGAFCFWESCHFLRSRQFGKAFRRLRSGPSRTSLGVDVYYPTVTTIRRAFRPHFRLLRWMGIGVLVPPSYVATRSGNVIARLARIDSVVSRWPLLRATADHRLLIFVRL